MYNFCQFLVDDFDLYVFTLLLFYLGCTDNFLYCRELRDLCQPQLTHVDAEEGKSRKKCSGGTACLPG